MFDRQKESFVQLLRWSERYTKTDMVYLVTSGFWTQSGSAFVSFASFLLYIVFGHYLPKDVYGTYQYLLSLGAIVGAFTFSGMGNAVARAVARGYEGTYLQSIRIQLMWSVVPMFSTWTVAAYYLWYGNTTIGWGLILIGIFVPLSGVYNTYTGYLSGKKDFRRGFVYNFWINVPYYLSVALVAVWLPLALALLAANVISQAIGYYVAHRRTIDAYKPNDSRDPEAIAYGAHLSLINLLGTVVGQLDNVLVFHYLGAADLALWSFATAVPNRLSIFGSLAGVAFPKYAQKTREDSRTSIGRKLSLSIAAAFGIALIYVVLAHPFFALFFPKYLDSVPYSQIYVFTVVASFSSIFIVMLTAHGRVKRLYVYNIATPLILLASEFIGLTHWGLWGLVWAVLAANLAKSFLSVVFALT